MEFGYFMEGFIPVEELQKPHNMSIESVVSMLCTAFTWNNLIEFEKWVKICLDKYYEPISKQHCFISNFMWEMLGSLAYRTENQEPLHYFNNHEFFQDIRHLNIILTYVHKHKRHYIANINKTVEEWSDLFINTFGYIINDRYLIDAYYDKDVNDARFESLYRCITDENDPLYETFGPLCKTLINNILQIHTNSAFDSDQQFSIVQTKATREWFQLDDTVEEQLETMNQIIRVCY